MSIYSTLVWIRDAREHIDNAMPDLALSAETSVEFASGWDHARLDIGETGALLTPAQALELGRAMVDWAQRELVNAQ